MPRWVYNPHTGGESIPPGIRTRTERSILDYAAKHYSGKVTQIDVRFHGALCYIDAFVEPDVPRESGPPAGQKRREWIEGFISAGFATSEVKTGGFSPGTHMPTKSTNQPS
jgi:hypothetical protein